MADSYVNSETPWRVESVMRELAIEKRLSGKEIADKLGCTPPTARRWLDNHGISQEDRKPWTDESLVLNLYTSGYGKREIADRLSCCEVTAYRALKEALEGSEHGYGCPNCCERFPTYRGMKQHYGRVHEGSLAGETVVCESCGDDFEVPPGRLETAKYCSDECLHGLRVDCTCTWCGGHLSRPPWQVDDYNNQFCNSTCHGEWISENQNGKDHPLWGGREEVCDNCGVEFPRSPSHPNLAHSFCTQDCYIEWLPDSVRSYGPGWTYTKKERVRERDGRECQVCGMSEDEHIKEYRRKLDVHHIIPAREFSDPEKRNAKDNLISLCIPHHRMAEQMAPLRPQPQSE